MNFDENHVILQIRIFEILEALQDSFFTHFSEPIDTISVPLRFNNPFNYEPHPLCIRAAKELQHYLLSQKDWEHDFGIDHFVEGTNIGKMFGVLVVRNKNGEVGYLSAFSGKLAGRNDLPHFVPPIVDLLNENSFYRIGEEELNQINIQVKELEESPRYIQLVSLFNAERKKASEEIEALKQSMKNSKLVRDTIRQEAELHNDEVTKAKILADLNKESIREHYECKQLNKEWKVRLDEGRKLLDSISNEILALKEKRKSKSAALQQRMFTSYNFLNSFRQSKNVLEIFEQTDLKIPPAGTGDCAAPKLLHYAFQHDMQPLVMAEFWWGQSPSSEIRRHGFFYPSCRSKCEPLLGHMLQGIDVEKRTHRCSLNQSIQPTIVYDDDSIVVLNKPSEYLSVPGKIEADTVYHFIKQRYPKATGPLIVHRLDMSTSGLMVVAKTEAAYHHLQQQFEVRTIKKRYIALLEGIVANEEGIIDLPLRVDLDNRPRQLVCYEYGKQAITRWKVLERKENRTLVHFFPKTGRTHQLRVHAAHSLGLNSPIVGDDLYGQQAERLYLHAEYIAFMHPETNEKIWFEVKAEF